MLNVLLIFSVKGTCIIQVRFQYLTDTQIIKKVLVRQVPLVSTLIVKCGLFFCGNNILKGMINLGPYIFLAHFKKIVVIC